MSNPTLKYGSKGSYVKTLQQKLGIRADGIFGTDTLNAVKAFQKKNGLTADGIVGAKTWAALDKVTEYRTVKVGSRGSLVSLLQELLTELRYQPGSIDGIYGSGTESAVKTFQKFNGLKVTGVANKYVWAAITGNNPVPNKTTTPVYYAQGDSRWGSKMYSATNSRSQTIASSGCGPTCMAMVVATKVNPKVQPPELCTYALEKGFRTANSGTSWGFFESAAKKYGLTCSQTSSTDTAVNAIKAGRLVIASMGPGYFTKGGHYILLYKADSNYIYCHDPAKKSRNKASIKSVFKKQSKQYFMIG